jgi:hypothetical protein
MMERLPGVLFPRGPAGKYRRLGIIIGALLTGAVALAYVAGVLMDPRAGRTGEDPALKLSLPMFAVAYLVGSYAAGAVWDATGRVRHRFSGYVLRGAGTAVAVFGPIVMVLPWMTDVDIPALFYLAIVGVLTVLGGLAGTGKWLTDRWMDDLPEPLDEQNPA